MADYWLQKAPNGSLLGADEETREALKRIKAGSIVLASVKVPRNAKFHRKIFALLKWAFDNVELPTVEYKGKEITPTFERFRHDALIAAGHYDVTVNMKGELRLDAKSIAYGKCDQATAESVYSSLLDVVAKKLFNGQFTREELDELTEEWRAFA